MYCCKSVLVNFPALFDLLHVGIELKKRKVWHTVVVCTSRLLLHCCQSALSYDMICEYHGMVPPVSVDRLGV